MSCHGAGRWARTARYSGCSKKPWRGGFSRRRSGKAGHGVEPAPVDGERAHAVEGRGLPVDGAGGRPGGAPGELILADLVRGQRGGPRGAAEEGGEMGGPAASGAVGPELPDLVVLEVGVAEISQGRPLGAECARGRCRRAGASGRVGRVVSCGSMDAGPPFRRPRAAAVHPHSLWWARQARGMCGGDGTAMEPVAYVRRRRPQVDPLGTCRHRFVEHRSTRAGAGTRTVRFSRAHQPARGPRSLAARRVGGV